MQNQGIAFILATVGATIGKRTVARAIFLSALLSAYCAGCDAPPIKPSLTDPDPSVKIPAMKQAVAERDMSAVPILIKNLDSDDPAVRFFANDALKKLTGRSFGFLYYEDEGVRRPAVEKWKAWYAGSAVAASKP